MPLDFIKGFHKGVTTNFSSQRRHTVHAVLAVIVVASCGRTSSAPKACLQFSSDLMPDLARGLIVAIWGTFLVVKLSPTFLAFLLMLVAFLLLFLAAAARTCGA